MDNVVVSKLKAQVVLSGSKKAAAEELGISPQYMGDLLSGRRGAGDDLLKRLGLRREEKLVKA